MTQQRSVSWNLPNIRLTQRYTKKIPSKRRRAGRWQQTKQLQNQQQYYQQQQEQIKSFLQDDDKIVVANDLIRFLYTSTLNNDSSEDNNYDNSNNETSSSCTGVGCDPSSHIANDIQLVGVDPKQPIHANRFVLAARSRVLRLMLYGNFIESKATVIPMDGFATTVIQAIVHYCYTNQLYLRNDDDTLSETTFRAPKVTDPINEVYIRRLVQLGQAADYFELYHLVSLVEDFVRQLMSLHPSIACIVYDEAIDTFAEVEYESTSSSDVPTTKKDEGNPRNVSSSSSKPNTNTTSSPDRNSSPVRSCNSSYDDSMNENPINGSSTTSTNRPNYPTGSSKSLSLFEYAVRYIECRPYVVLDCNDTGIGGIECIHDPTKLEYIFKDPNISASEVFLFRMLQHWYEVHISSTSHLYALQNALGSSSTTATTFDIAKRCTNYIQFQNIEPNLLLSTSSNGDGEDDIVSTATTSIIRYKALVSQEQIFDAIAQQALRSCNDGIWQIRYRPGHTAALPLSSSSSSSQLSSSAAANAEIVERVLVEGAGNRDVNGMYYRIGAGLNLMNGILYSKREVTCGQSIVYTLSCCTVSVNSNNNNNSNEEMDNTNGQEGQSNTTPQLVREFRIFSNQFLTYRAVRNLDLLQQQQQQGSSNGSPGNGTTSNNVPSPNGCTIKFSPMFQPVLQVIGPIYEPDESDITIPTPIRKYYRIRLSDGKIHMPATLARELSPLVENGDIATNHVIKVLEFGLYQIMNPTSDSGTFNDDEYNDPNHTSTEFTSESSTTALHVIKATIVTTAPVHPLGLPISLEEYNKNSNGQPQQQQQQRRASNSSSYGRNNEIVYDPMDDPTQQGLQNLYICRTPIEPSSASSNFMYSMDPQQQHRIAMSSSFGSSPSPLSPSPLLPPFKIPRNGWEVGDHGTYPVPTCTWIPVVTKKKRGKK